jgi:hypothetical protein
MHSLFKLRSAKKLSKVNNRPFGENSPNLVTLTISSLCRQNLFTSEDILGRQQSEGPQVLFSVANLPRRTLGTILRNQFRL